MLRRTAGTHDTPPGFAIKPPTRYDPAMTDLSFSIPSSLESRVQQRIADGGYADAGAYLRDLIQRDLDEAADTAWVRRMIEEGEASGYIERDAREVLREIAEERRARRA
ncbi:hypothetical protein NJ75_01832 [Novosphingobium subterraneum]|uniref:Addiction module antidote protein n=2 Tax=Novosphingobium subterraneum TaxID=48936 RepID=A0A0B9A8P7_9SPHN|nr:hypothetical protein NJ75_01832 [Novosphingobium subterraneum]